MAAVSAAVYLGVRDKLEPPAPLQGYGYDPESAPMLPQSLPEAPMPQQPRRLPPVSAPEPESSGPSLPGIVDDGSERPVAPDAPLPPPSSNSAIRHLPRVN